MADERLAVPAMPAIPGEYRVLPRQGPGAVAAGSGALPLLTAGDAVGDPQVPPLRGLPDVCGAESVSCVL